ncbi:MAG: Uma2 family endonuclease [Syntrophobacteraceae bacterium]|nr:Uma2 family endonuclease [Syntrophobacteraceae bacterium]
MSTQTAAESRRYTYRDYLTFPEDLRCEIIDGKLHDMTPSPTPGHQRVSVEICFLIRDHLRKHAQGCQVFDAPLDVVIAEDQVVQPDVFIVCDRQKIEKTRILGAPDVIFEILSPSSSLKDRREKMDLYERAGVGEYFLVDPDGKYIEKFLLSAGKYYRAAIYAEDAPFFIDAIGLELKAGEVFAE